jgi:hypothetical protein
MISGALLLAGAGMGMGSVFMTWRAGAGMTGIDKLPGALGPGFEARTYGISEVKGMTVRSWHDTMVLMCARAAKVKVDADLVETGACDSNDSRYEEECNPMFLDALEKRCEAYSAVYTYNKGIFMIAALTVVLNAVLGAAMIVPKGPLLKFRHMVLPGAVCAGLQVLVAATVWCYISDNEFKVIGKKVEFPYPSLAMGFYVFVVAAFLTLGGGAMAWAEFTGTAPKEEDEPL